MYNYFPLIIKKDKNFSKEMYYILNSNKRGDYNENLRLQQTHREEPRETKELNKLMDFIWDKIEERFPKLANAFRFFDLDNNGKINYKEFAFGLEKLRIKCPQDDLKRVFNSLDKDKNGDIDYREFTNLCEEKRREIDPFDVDAKTIVMGDRYRTKSQDGNSINKSLDAQSLRKINAGDERSRKLPDDLLSQTTNYYKGYKQRNKMRMRPLPQNLTNDNNIYGAHTLKTENMKDIMENNFQKNYVDTLIEEREKILKAKSEQKRNPALVHHNKAYVLRHEALQKKVETEKEAAQVKKDWKLKQYETAGASSEVTKLFNANQSLPKLGGKQHHSTERRGGAVSNRHDIVPPMSKHDLIMGKTDHPEANEYVELKR